MLFKTGTDLVAILVAEGPPPSSDPPQAGDGQAQRCLTDSAPAFEPFVSFIVSAFAAQTASDLFELSSLISRLWPTWIKRVEDGEGGVHHLRRDLILIYTTPTNGRTFVR